MHSRNVIDEIEYYQYEYDLLDTKGVSDDEAFECLKDIGDNPDFMDDAFTMLAAPTKQAATSVAQPDHHIAFITPRAVEYPSKKELSNDPFFDCYASYEPEPEEDLYTVFSVASFYSLPKRRFVSFDMLDVYMDSYETIDMTLAHANKFALDASLELYVGNYLLGNLDYLKDLYQKGITFTGLDSLRTDWIEALIKQPTSGQH